jgi:hypothetical protein
MSWLTIAEYLYHKWTRISSICRIHNPGLNDNEYNKYINQFVNHDKDTVQKTNIY